MFDLCLFQLRIDSFSEEYTRDFFNFWIWKVKIESKDGANLLDDQNRAETYHRLCSVLPKWQTYRPLDNTPCLTTLKTSLSKITEAYNKLRKYTLLNFEQIPRSALESVWQELGRAKEKNGQINDYGYYAIISVCKPLLFLWGQTLAFDSRVRKNLPRNYKIDRYSGNWNIEEWIRVMTLMSSDLNQDKKAIQFIEEKSAEWYGKNAPVPYGRLLDIYYFEGS